MKKNINSIYIYFILSISLLSVQSFDSIKDLEASNTKIDKISNLVLIVDSLGVDTLSLCQDEDFKLDISGRITAASILWSPRHLVDCDTCTTVQISSLSSQYLYLNIRDSIEVCTDSIFLNVRERKIVLKDTTLCHSDSLLFNGTYIREFGVHHDTLSGQNLECDTVVSMVVKFAPPTDTIMLDTTLCQGDTLVYLDNIITEPGQYTAITTDTTTGCVCMDIMLDVKYLQAIDVINDVETICQGDSILINEQWVSSSGNYRDTIRSISGCDSIRASIDVFIMDTVEIKRDTNLCFGDSLLFNNTWITEMGTFQGNLESQESCDTIVSLQVTFSLPPDIITIDTMLCDGESFDFFGDQISQAGTYEHSIEDITTGCANQNIILTVTYAPPIEIITHDTLLCDGDTLLFYDESITEAGIYQRILEDSLTGCMCKDVTVTVNYAAPAQFIGLDTVLCFGESVVIGNTVIDSDFEDMVTISNSLGCDSIIQGVRVRFRPESISDERDSLVCPEFIEAPFSVIDTVLNSKGCDSIYSVINFNAVDELEVTTEESITAFQGTDITLSFSTNKAIDIIQWTGEGLSCTDCESPRLTANESQQLTLYLQDSDGCDTTLFIDITVQIPVDIFVPNVIDVSEDGVNGAFYVITSNTVNVFYDITVFDRWGSIVYEAKDILTNDYRQGWNGTSNGDPVEQGVYIYMLTIRANNTERVISGDLTVVR